MDKINNIGLARELLKVYDFDGFTPQEVWSRIAQKMNIIIEHFNYLDKKFDNQKELVDSKLSYLLNEGLTEQVSKKIIALINDGTIGELINGTLLKEINDKVDTFQQTFTEQLDNNTSYLNDITINVKMFGAKGDGVTDDTQAIQNAVNSGKKIYFPIGKYKITSTIQLPNNLITLYGVKRESVILADETVNIVFSNVKKYSYFNNLDIHFTNICFQGSISYCEFENIYCNGDIDTSIALNDLDDIWCGFTTFINCTFLNSKCVLKTDNSINYVKFNDCTFQYLKYVICGGGSEAISFNHCDFEFMQNGTIFVSRSRGLAYYRGNSFNDCYIENASILNTDIVAFNGESQLKTALFNTVVNGGWVYNEIPLFKMNFSPSSIKYSNVYTITQTQTTPLFHLTGDISLMYEQGYCACLYKIDSSTTNYNDAKNIIQGTSRCVLIIASKYNQWEVSNDIKFNNGIILGDTLPKNSSKGAMVYASDGNFKVTNGSNSIPILGLVYRATSLADLKAITGLTDVCFGLAKDTKELYFYDGSAWKKVNYTTV